MERGKCKESQLKLAGRNLKLVSTNLGEEKKKKKKGCMKSPHAEIPEGVAVMAHPGSANLLEKVFIWNMPVELLF